LTLRRSLALQDGAPIAGFCGRWRLGPDSAGFRYPESTASKSRPQMIAMIVSGKSAARTVNRVEEFDL
jgi:hypothetical protein